MTWFADSKDSYRSGEYLVCFVIQGWNSWLMGKRFIGHAETMKGAMKLCEEDAHD